MSKKPSKHSTVLDLLSQGKSEEFKEILSDKGIRILRKGKDINRKQKTELYLNESELQKAGVELIDQINNCLILCIDNVNIACVRGKFIGFKGKIQNENLNLKELYYQREVESSGGQFIIFHSVFELETKLLKLNIISKPLL